MKMVARATILAAAAVVVPAAAGAASPIGKVVQLISDFQAKVIKEGEEAQRVYAEFSEWCEDRARNLAHEIKTGASEVESLKAAIAQEEATTATLNAKTDELAAAIATDEADLKAATHIRATEHKDFVAEEAELVETVDMLERAIGILEREMAKGGASMMQLKNAASLSQALSAMVDVAAISSADAAKLSAFVQSAQREGADDDQEPGAPAAAVYEGHSSDIIETLQGLKDKADEQLDTARKTETNNLHVFQQLEQSLKDEIKFSNQDLQKAKKGLAASAEAKSKAAGDLQVTSKDLAADQDTKADLHRDCMTKAEDFEAATKSRAEELEALAGAKKAIVEATGGAEAISYSLLQSGARSSLSSAMDLANFEAVRLVRSIAEKQNSQALMLLAQRMGSAMRSSDDPFAKVKGLISDMIERLEGEAEQDATHKAYCDKELKESEEKKADKTAEVTKLTTKIDSMKARSAMLKEEVAQLQSDLAALAKSQAQMDKIREEEHAEYVSNKADMEQGLQGVKLALKILNEYYSKEGKAHTAQSGAGANIIGLIEVCESDFSKNLAEIESTEETAAAEYDRETKENAVEKTTKDKDVEYKTKESVDLDKESAELSSDRSNVQAELDAVLEYLTKIHKECDEVAETYAQRKARFEAEIAGLKEALTILENEAALLQRRSAHHRRQQLRGARA